MNFNRNDLKIKFKKDLHRRGVGDFASGPRMQESIAAAENRGNKSLAVSSNRPLRDMFRGPKSKSPKLAGERTKRDSIESSPRAFKACKRLAFRALHTNHVQHLAVRPSYSENRPSMAGLRALSRTPGPIGIYSLASEKKVSALRNWPYPNRTPPPSTYSETTKVERPRRLT